MSKREQTKSDVAKIISDLINGIDPDTVDELKNNIAPNPYFPLISKMTSLETVKKKPIATLARRKAILIKYLTNAILTPDENAELYLTVAEKKYINSLITDSNLDAGYKLAKTGLIDNLGTAPMSQGLPMGKMMPRRF